jgi:hypothetical protein
MFELTREVLVNEQNAQLIHQWELYDMHFHHPRQSPPNAKLPTNWKKYLQLGYTGTRAQGQPLNDQSTFIFPGINKGCERV